MVVLPFVPVAPSTRMANAGSPWKRAASGPNTARTDLTRAWGTSTGTQRSTKRDRAARHGGRGVDVAVGDAPLDAAEQGARTDFAAVVYD